VVRAVSLYLISPGGKTVQLFNRHGGAGDNLTNTVFDDEAGTAIAAGTAPFTRSFRPVAPLSALDHARANGTWKLKIVDQAAIDTGTLNSWSLSLRRYVCS
jgi:subtilisin-like proprotein convertase family protein